MTRRKRTRKYAPQPCAHCGNLFIPRLRAGRPGLSRFCSRSCGSRTTNRPKGVTGPKRRPIEDRLWPKVRKTDDCWDFLGALRWGYGVIGSGGHDGPTVYAHRLAWEIASGAPVPPGHQINHTCDRRICVRNDDAGVYIVKGVELPRFGHLFLGTHATNTADMIAKGRGRNRRRDA